MKRSEPVVGDPAKPWTPTIQWVTNDGKPPPMPSDDLLDDDVLFDQQHRVSTYALIVRHITVAAMLAATYLLVKTPDRIPLVIGLVVMLVGVGGVLQIITKARHRLPEYAPILDAIVLGGVLWLKPMMAPYILLICLGQFAVGVTAYGAAPAAAAALLVAFAYPLAIVLHKGTIAPDWLVVALMVANIPAAAYLHGRLRTVERASRKKYLDLLGGLDAVVWEADPTTLELTFASPQVREIFGFSPNLFIGKWSEHVHPDDREREIASRRGAIENGEEEFILEHRMTTRAGEVLHVRNKFSIEYDGSKRATRVRGAIVDVTRQQEAEATIRKQAQYDTLTGLPNRSLFNDQLKRRLEEARRSNEGLAVLLLDLNGFKEVNDTLGHAVGDNLLQAIAGRLAAYLPERSLVARLGGDEFAVMVYPANSRSAAGIAESIASCLQPPVTVDAMTIQAGAATGIALYPGDGDTPASLLRRADAAMYEAKQSGRSHMFATPDDDEANVRRLQLLGELRASITTGDFRLFHQPKIDLRTGAIVGTEGLIRWQHRQFGLLSPAEFVELTELSGLIQPLTRWVIEQGIRDLSEWRKSGYELMVALNLSVRNFFDQGLPAFIAQLLSDYKVPGDQLVLEITEREVMADRALARSALSAFRSLGVKISIDDFGTGFSSLSQLQQLPIDEIKVDQSFVQGMLTNPQDGVIVRSIIDLGHNLDLEVVAEGAEDWDQLAALRDLGADRAQGYIVSRPVPGDQFPKWLESLQRTTINGRVAHIFKDAPLGERAPGKFGSASGRVLVAAGSRLTDAKSSVATSVAQDAPISVLAPPDPRSLSLPEIERRGDPIAAALTPVFAMAAAVSAPAPTAMPVLAAAATVAPPPTAMPVFVQTAAQTAAPTPSIAPALPVHEVAPTIASPPSPPSPPSPRPTAPSVFLEPVPIPAPAPAPVPVFASGVDAAALGLPSDWRALLGQT